jgi:outer membrane protein assembly factor BamB
MKADHASARSGATSGPALLPVLRALALAAGFLCALVGALLAFNHRQAAAADPLNSTALLGLMEKAAAQPGDTNLLAQVRAMDLLARRAFFGSQAFADRGAWLMLAGALVFLAALKGSSVFLPLAPPPAAAPLEDAPLRAARAARAAAWAYGALLAAGLAALALAFRPPPAALPTDPGGGASAAVAAPDFADDAAMAANWPAFRGFRGTSAASAMKLPTAWDPATGAGVIWKSDVPRPGFSSAVVWEDRVLVTGADAEAREIFCYNAGTGKLEWRHVAEGVPGSPATLPKVSSDTGHAAATPCTDGRRVFAIFSTGDLLACDLEGRRLWARNLGVPKNPYGHASSLLTHRDLLIVQYDQADSARLVAFRTATGEEAWSVKREVRASWASPIVVESGGRFLVLALANPALIVYDAASGAEAWRAGDFGAEIGCSPAAAGGRVYAGNEYASLIAAELADGRVLWEIDEGLSDVTSPLPLGGAVVLATSSGLVSARNAATGERLWEHEFPEGFYSSAVAAGGLVYLTDMSGVTRIFRAEPAFELVAEPALGEKCFATPALRGGRMFLRGERHLFAIGGSSDAGG